MIKIIPIATTSIDWNIYLLSCKELLGRSITIPLDVAKRNIGDLGSFMASLAVFQDENANIDLQHAGALLRFASISFLVVADKNIQMEIMCQGDLKVLVNDNCVIVSGTLEEWRNAVINGTTDNVTFDIRYFFDLIILYFESIGLGGIWSHDYQKVRLKDQTFKLLEK